MILVEFSLPFQWRPSIWRSKSNLVWRFMWGWLAVAHTPFDFNEFIEALAAAAIKEYGGRA